MLACAVCGLAGWRGTDWAAQVYRAHEASHWALAVWDPGWYGGTYPLNYSLVYPLAAGYVGLWPLAALSAAGAAFCFDRLACRRPGPRPAGSWYFALSTVIQVAIGQLPTLAGEAFALASVLCLVHYRGTLVRHGGTVARYRGTVARYAGTTDRPRGERAWGFPVAGVGLGAIAALSSPVVGAFLALAFVAWALSDLGRAPAGQLPVVLLAATLTFASTAALPLLFPGPGYFPFGFGDLVVTLAICALLACPPIDAPRPVKVGAALYAAVSIALFVVKNPVGDNDTRLAAYIGVPLALCYLPGLARRMSAGRGGRADPLRHWGQLRQWGAITVAAAMAASLIVWHWSPVRDAMDGTNNGPPSTAAYYRPLIDELGLLSKGHPVRVEIPPLAHHWESAYVAPSFPLARGWERQLDVAYDPLFYRSGPLTPSEYRTWLLANGVSFVAMADAPLDYAATAEATLLRSGQVKGLQAVWHTSNWQLWRVIGSQGLASAPATVVALSPRSVEVRFSRPGVSTLKLRWSAFWSLAPSAVSAACLSRAPGGWTELEASDAGAFRLSMSVLNADHGKCPRPGDLRSG